MTHDIVFQHFRACLPRHASETIAWFPNGKNSIRVRYEDGRDFIFTFNNELDWCYETAEHFIKRLKGD